MLFETLLAIFSIAAAAIAAICGFGIGSLITPILNLRIEMGIAVALVSIPHFVATLLRAAKLKDHINWQFLKKFGIASAIGSLAGALLSSTIPGAFQAMTLASLMIFVGSLGLSGKTKDFIIPEKLLLIAGALSGMLGGLVGNQGGVRSAAMLSTDLKKEEFVASATATGVIVDLARMPVYIYTQSTEMVIHYQLIILMTLCCITGTYIGIPLLKLIPESSFKKGVYIIVLSLGLFVFGRILFTTFPLT